VSGGKWHFETWVLEQATIALKAQEKNRVEDLTDEERVALAVCAGCEIEPRFDGDEMYVKTLRRVGYAKMDGRWIVAQEPREWLREGDTIKIQLPTREVRPEDVYYVPPDPSDPNGAYGLFTSKLPE
jgi:hypothetical protein